MKVIENADLCVKCSNLLRSGQTSPFEPSLIFTGEARNLYFESLMGFTHRDFSKRRANKCALSGYWQALELFTRIKLQKLECFMSRKHIYNTKDF